VDPGTGFVTCIDREIVYEVVGGAEGLARLREAWEALEVSSAKQIFQTFAYAQLWMRTVGEHTGAVPLIVTLRENGTTVGIFPLCRGRENGVPVLTWLGGPRAFDYGDVLFDPTIAETTVDDFVGESLRLFAEAGRGSMLYLTNVRDDAIAAEPLRAALKVLKRSSAPYAPIVGTYDEFLATRGRSLRYNLNRKWRRLEKSGEAKAEMLVPGDPQIVPTMARLVEFQRVRHRAAGNRTNLFDERFVNLRTELATSHPAARVSRIQLDGVTIAACLHAVHRDRLYCLVPGFDGEFSTYSPGQLLYGFVIRSCFENGWNICDFCWGDEPHKYEWTDLDETLTTFVSNDSAGALLCALTGAGRRLAGALKAKPKPKRSP